MVGRARSERALVDAGVHGFELGRGEDAIEAREPFIRSRTRNVATYAVATARELGLGAEQVDQVLLGAILCNLGMIRVPEAILHKQGTLTAEEHARVRHHPIRSAEMLSGVPQFEPVIPIVLHYASADPLG